MFLNFGNIPKIYMGIIFAEKTFQNILLCCHGDPKFGTGWPKKNQKHFPPLILMKMAKEVKIKKSPHQKKNFLAFL